MYSTKYIGAIAVLALLTLGAGCSKYVSVNVDTDAEQTEQSSDQTPVEVPAVETPTTQAPAPTPSQPTTTPTAPVVTTTSRSVSFKAVGDSKVTGTATFTKVKEGLRVAITLRNTDTGVSHSANIESGTCAQRGEMRYQLNNVIKGSSVTILNDLTLEHIFTKDKTLSIKVKPTNASPYVSCADIR